MQEKTSDCNFNRLKNFPVSFLSIILGLVGFALVYQRAEAIFGLPIGISVYLLYLVVVLSLVFAVIYLLKTVKYPKEVSAEFNHPIKINFFPIIAKIFLIASIIFLSLSMVYSQYLWYIGVILQFVFTFVIMSFWIRHDKFEIHHINPSWFIPVVGNIIIPIAGVQHFNPELSWFFFSIGFFWWLVLFTIVIYRMVFHQPIAEKLLPTLFILFAPPAIGYISLVKLIGEPTIFANMLYYFAFFLFLLVLFQVKLFLKIRFYLSWWAYSFPMDALTIATFLMYHQTGSAFFKWLSIAMFSLLNLIIVFLVYKTIVAIKNKEICVEERD